MVVKEKRDKRVQEDKWQSFGIDALRRVPSDRNLMFGR